ALLLVAVRPARDRRVDLEEVPGVPAQRERATDVAVALRSGRRRVVEREPAVDEEEVEAELRAERARGAGARVHDVDAADGAAPRVVEDVTPLAVRVRGLFVGL